jgi:hypothetical protein
VSGPSTTEFRFPDGSIPRRLSRDLAAAGDEARSVWKKVLVAVSRTDTPEQAALQRALALAEKEITEIELLRVVYDSSLESSHGAIPSDLKRRVTLC